MTNEQLAILLDVYAAALDAAIVEAEATLPSDVERRLEWRYKGTDLAARAVAEAVSGLADDRDPKLWEQVPGEAVCLEALWELYWRIIEHVNILRGVHGQD